MNTDTGRIYDLEELYPDKDERGRRDALNAELLSLRVQYPDLPTTEVAWSDPAIALTIEEQRRELAIARAKGKAVMVSGDVAQTMKLGQRERERRAKRRTAAKQARKRNR